MVILQLVRSDLTVISSYFRLKKKAMLQLVTGNVTIISRNSTVNN